MCLYLKNYDGMGAAANFKLYVISEGCYSVYDVCL